MKYQYEATSVEGFIQQLACNYLPHGYWFYVSGWVPDGKAPESVDRKLTEKYGICISRQSRARRKLSGQANLHYLRYDRFFVLLATHGKHTFFAEESANIRDVRKVPIKFAGHSITYKQGSFRRRIGDNPPEVDHDWHSRVQIERERYADLKAYFLDAAIRRSKERLAGELFALPYEPYAPVRQQLLNLLRLVNKARHAANLERVTADVLRYQRTIVKPFHQTTQASGNRPAVQTFWNRSTCEAGELTELASNS